MPANALAVFDTTLQKTNTWLNEISEDLGWRDQQSRQDAYRALRATLHAVRDRLVVDEAADLGSQLPMLVRGIYYENWQPSRTPQRVRDREEFLARVRGEYDGRHDAEPEDLVRASLRAVAAHVDVGEIEHVRGMFPAELQDFWPRR